MRHPERPGSSSRLGEDELSVPDLYRVAVFQAASLNQVLVWDLGSVCAEEVFDVEAIVLASDVGMPFGDAVIAQDDLASHIPAEDGNLLAEWKRSARCLAL